MKDATGADPTGIGQNHEWQIWSNLTWGTGADLHVFLPTKDMGVDGIVRRPATDLMVPVQAKGRTHLDPGNILRVRVQENEATDDRVKVVVVVSGPGDPGLRSPAMVIGVDELKRISPLRPMGPRLVHPIDVPYPPGPRTRWRQYFVPLRELPEAVCPGADVTPAWLPRTRPVVPPDQEELAAIGYRGEVEFLRCAASRTALSVFHAAPDNEFDEYLLRHLVTGGISGVQVKCIEVSPESPSGVVHVTRRSFHASPRANLAVFAVRQDGGAIHEQCFLIPSTELEGLSWEGGSRLSFTYAPDDPADQLRRYGLPVAALGEALEAATVAALR